MLLNPDTFPSPLPLNFERRWPGRSGACGSWAFFPDCGPDRPRRSVRSAPTCFSPPPDSPFRDRGQENARFQCLPEYRCGGAWLTSPSVGQVASLCPPMVGYIHRALDRPAGSAGRDLRKNGGPHNRNGVKWFGLDHAQCSRAANALVAGENQSGPPAPAPSSAGRWSRFLELCGPSFDRETRPGFHPC